MRFWIVFSLFVAVTCTTGCGSRNAGGAAAVDEALRPLVPADTTVLAGVQINRLRETPLYQRHKSEIEIPLLAGSTERLGFDPRQDLSEALIAWNGKRTLVLARGKWKRASVEQKLSAFPAPQTDYKGHLIFGDGSHSLVLLDRELAIEGTAADVREAIDLQASLQASPQDRMPEELREQLRAVPRADQVWLVSRGGLPFADAPMRSDFASALSNIANYISRATAGLEAGSGLHVHVDIGCISEQGARRVHDALRGGIGLARLSTRDDQRQLLQLYDAIRVDQDNASVHVQADLSADVADKLIEQLKQLQRR